MGSNCNWRTGVTKDRRQKIVERLMEIRQGYEPRTGELLEIVYGYEEDMFRVATDVQGYLRMVSKVMISWRENLETYARAIPANAMQGRLGGAEGVVESLDPGAKLLMQNGAQNLSNAGQLSDHVPGQAQQRWQVFDQSVQNNLNVNVMQSSPGLGSSLSGLTGTPPRQMLPQPGASNPQQPVMYGLQQHRKQRAIPESSTASIDASRHSGAVVGLNVMQSSSGLGSSLSGLSGTPPQQMLPQPAMYGMQQHQKERAVPESSSASVDASRHSGAVVGLDHREVLWRKLQMLKDKYLQDLKEVDALMTTRRRATLTLAQSQKLEHYTHVVREMIDFLTRPKERISRKLKEDTLEAFEKQTVAIMEKFKRHRQRTQQSALPPQPHLLPNQGPQSPPQQQQQQRQEQQQFLSQIQQQHNNGMQQQPTSSTLHFSNLSPIPQNLGSALQQTGMFSLHRTGLNAAQPHATPLHTSNVNLSPQSGVTSLQPSGVSAMPQNGGHILQQNSVNPLQQSVADSLQRNRLNFLQPSGTITHQPAVVHHSQQSIRSRV